MLQRKTVTLVEEYEYICHQDDALHQEDPEFELKWEQYLDGGPAPLRPGGRPTTFKLRHLSTVAKDRLMPYLARAEEDREYWPSALAAAFALALVSVENYTAKDGTPLKVKHAIDDGLHKVPVVSEETVNEFDSGTVIEVGSRVISRLNPSPK